MIKGLDDRLKEEITKLAPDGTQIRVIAATNARTPCGKVRRLWPL